MILKWQLYNIQASKMKSRTFGIQYYNIINILNSSSYRLEKASVQPPVLFYGLVVFIYKTSQTPHNSFPEFCIEQISPIIKEKKLPFIICLMPDAEPSLSSWKKVMEALQYSLKDTHWIIRKENPRGI